MRKNGEEKADQLCVGIGGGVKIGNFIELEGKSD